MKRIILLAIVSYFLIAPFTYHPDTKLTLRYPALENGQVWDIYGYINSHKLDIPDFHYPPAHYWWLKIHYPISKFVGGPGFDKWLSSGSAQASFNTNVLRFNFAAKLPLLILGLLCGWLIFLIVNKASKDQNKAKLAALFWYFNPITLYSLVIMGQNDIVAIFLFLLGIQFYEKWWLTALLWGIASGVKSYPIVWSVMFLLVWEKKIIKLVLKGLSVIAVYGLILLPWLEKDYFTQAVLNSGLSQRMLIANIGVGFGKEILVVPLLLVIVALKAWWDKTNNKTYRSTLAIFQSSLIILAFSHFNPQWMLWTIPFLAIWGFVEGIRKKEWLVFLIIFIVWIGLTLSFDDKFLTWGLLTPINPNLINFPSIPEFIRNKGGDISSFTNLCQSVLAGAGIWFMVNKFKNKEKTVSTFKLNNSYILIPWMLIGGVILLISGIKTENKTFSQLGNKEIYLNETVDKRWEYEVLPNLKYFEISLDNSSLSSQDKGILVISDNNQNEFEKEFSGFNAGAKSWLRVDVPASMSNANYIMVTTKDVVSKDGLLKIQLDDNDRWAINFYNYDKSGRHELTAKILAFWWGWATLVGLSIFYLKVKKD